jgi:hypothetical protein
MIDGTFQNWSANSNDFLQLEFHSINHYPVSDHGTCIDSDNVIAIQSLSNVLSYNADVQFLKHSKTIWFLCPGFKLGFRVLKLDTYEWD